LAALRVRNRIFEVLRLGTPMSGGYESMISPKNNVFRESIFETPESM